MQKDLMNLSRSSIVIKLATEDTLKCNDYTQKFGLVLSEEQAMKLVVTRAKSLEANGRIEFGGGIVEKLIWAFCDSPYISQDNYTQTIHELIECFYYFKNDTIDLCSDDEMIAFMVETFHGKCQGSVELLRGRDMERIAANLRYGRTMDYEEDE